MTDYVTPISGLQAVKDVVDLLEGRLGPFRRFGDSPDLALLAAGRRAGDEEISKLDELLSALLEQYWSLDPWGRRSARIWAHAFRVAARLEGLHRFRSELRLLAQRSAARLLPLARGLALDPWADFLDAISATQPDRGLFSYWISLCDLPVGVHPHHGVSALSGVRALPEPEDGRPDLCEAYVRFAWALGERVVTRRIRAAQASEIFTAVSRLLEDQMNVKVLGEKLDLAASRHAFDDIPKPTRAWLDGISVRRGVTDARGIAARRTAFRDRAAKLLSGPASVSGERINEMMELLEAERDHARRTGDTDPISKSLTRFALSAVRVDPTQAIEWARESTVWEPETNYSWTALIQVQRTVDPLAASATGYLSTRLLPADPLVWLELGISLRESQHFDLARAILALAVARLPKEERLQDQLGHVLLLCSRWPEAEAAYRAALELSGGGNEHSWDGLIVVLFRQSRIDEARAAAREARERFPHNPLFRSREDQINAGQFPSAGTPGVEGALQLDGLAATQQARLVRQASAITAVEASLLHSAYSRLDDTDADGGGVDLAQAVLEEGLRLKAAGELDAAETHLERALTVFPSDAPLLHGLAVVRRALLKRSDSVHDPDRYAWAIEPVDRFEAVELMLEPLASWSRLRVLAVTSDGYEWEAARMQALRSFSASTASTKALDRSAVSGFVRVWQEAVAMYGSGVVSPSTDFVSDEVDPRLDALDEEFAAMAAPR